MELGNVKFRVQVHQTYLEILYEFLLMSQELQIWWRRET
jgi:hypothetical protein